LGLKEVKNSPLTGRLQQGGQDTLRERMQRAASSEAALCMFAAPAASMTNFFYTSFLTAAMTAA
jgi:hypothetical protein